MQQHRNTGFLISIEGIDGSGKSTLVEMLSKRLSEKFSVTQTKEPGGTPSGISIRKLIQAEHGQLDAKAEFLLFAADRAQHFAQLIEPALARGDIVISDRMADSSLVYQGYTRGLDIPMIKTINQWAMNERTPDLVLYVRINAKTAIARIDNRNAGDTMFEREQFLEQAQRGFDELLEQRDAVLTLDGQLSPEQLCNEAYQAVVSRIQLGQDGSD